VKNHLTKLHKFEAFKKARFSRANLTVFAIIFASIGGYLIYSSFAATAACTSHATTANFASTFSGATGGQTICLAAGNYGAFNGGTKSSPGVTITSDTAAGGTQANVIFSSVTLSGSQNITLDNLTIGQAANDAFSIQSNPTNVAITNSILKGFTEIDNIGSTNHVNVLFDHDNFSQTGVDCFDMGHNAIIGLHYSGAGHSGVTVQNSVIGNSDCDGVHTGTGIDVLNNDFKNICEDSPTDPQHTDHMQFEGSIGGRIAGNYFHSLVPDSVCITQALTSFDSGTDGVLIENNVMDTSRGFGVEFYGDKNSIIRHNTVVYRSSGCATGACRGISISCRDATKANGGVSQCPPNAGFGTQIYDNLALPIDINHEGTNGPDPTLARNDHNFSAQGVTYMGGSNPPPAGGFAAHDDYLLASSSTLKGAASDGTDPGVYAVNNGTAWPLKKSANNRYLVDQNNNPYLMVGDSPQSAIGNLSMSEADRYFADRQAHGFNTVWINLLCGSYTFCNADGSTKDGIKPFTTGSSPSNYDLSTPNATYFSRADAIINSAASHDLTVILDPIETGAWLTTMQSNGVTKDTNFGKYLGNRYKTFPNIIWMSGNDFQSWSNASDDAVVRAVAQGIQANDTAHIHSLELDFLTSSSLNDTNWANMIQLNASYTYYPTYAEVLKGYNQTPTMPDFMVEASYEFEHNGGTDGGSPPNLRRQEYWTMTSGATGQLYGSGHTDGIANGWLASDLDSIGVTELGYLTNLLQGRAWYDLVPDQAHTLVTVGYGTFQNTGLFANNDYVTAAKTADGSLALAYVPTAKTITVDMSRLSGAVTAKWYDVTAGTYATISGSPFANSGTRQFATPGTHSDGTSDWVLVLTAGASTDTTPPTVSLTAPSAGSTVSGTAVTLSANAADNVGVNSVQFKVDGNNAGSPDLSAPYSTAWDSTSAANGTHSLTAVASDSAGNSTTSSPVSITVDNGNILTIGETTITPNSDSGNANLLIAQQATLGQSATIQSMSFYVVNAAGKLRLGLYDATGPGGGPGVKKTETAEITPVAGWNTANVTSQILLPAGSYWLAYLPSDNNLSFRNSSSTTTPSRFYTFTYGTMPATYSTAPSTTTSHWSLYATFNIASAGPKSGDINGDNSVNITDLSFLLSSYGQNTTNCITNNAFKCDLSSPGDGAVNIFDLSILLSHYGT
jgi:hypothetical protein